MKHKRDERAFARVQGSPGERPRLVGFARATWPLLIILAAAGYLLRAALPAPALSPTAIGFLLLLLCGVLAYAIVWSERRLSQFIKGARGEELVARALAFLSAEYRVFHGVSMSRGLLARRGDYDHVVVGPTGIFVLETKNWSGLITVSDGEILCDDIEPDRPPLEQVRQGAADLRRRLQEEAGVNVTVHPVLCFAGGRLVGGTTGVEGVVVCTIHALEQVLKDSVDAPLAKDVRDRVVGFLEALVAAE
ncbi:MAG: NERD domain-containing protein [Kiritimatiellae bacterium]|nr:NERD domain-containing protein [Kiritimatiellia bacterium]